MKAGAYYWNGWWGKNAGGLKDRLLNEFADREPLWGWIGNTVENMELQIDYASKAGLKFFAFDWYHPEGEISNADHLNAGTELFLKAANRSRMEFCLLVANHRGYRIYPKDWKMVVEQWIRYFKEDTYLMVDQKPFLIFFSSLTICMGGVEGVRHALDYLQTRAKEEGFAGVSVAACEEPFNHDLLYTKLTEGFTHFTAYNYPGGWHYKGPERMIHAYRDLVENHKRIWNGFCEQSYLPYIPCVTIGWDARPWESPDHPEEWSWYYPDRTPEQAAEFVASCKQWIKENPQATVKEQIALIYAWNELGEGGYMLPTKGDGGRYLELIGRVLNSD